MEENKAQQAINQLCKRGCGFFGSSKFDGCCSQCFKDKEKKDLEDNGLSSYTYQDKSFGDSEEVKKIESESSTSTKGSLAHSSTSSSFASIVTDEIPKADITMSDTSITITTEKKKNRCNTCRKKVGLTGFSCRCGGMYCSMHRYSDSHNCTYDYKEEAVKSIRKANPRIVSDKISKI